MDNPIQHAQDAHGGTFFIMAGSARIAEMTYVRSGEGRVVIDHTFVDPSLRGRNVARRLLDAAADWARSTGTKVSATCSYVQVQFARDAGFADIMG